MLPPPSVFKHAKRIRKSLTISRSRFLTKNKHQHLDFPLDLGGACGLASLLLCIAIGDTELKFLKGTDRHAWNEFPFPCREKKLIVDITATQFNHDIITAGGVFVGATSQEFHRGLFLRGHEMLKYMRDVDWYTAPRPGATPGEIRRWKTACAVLSRNSTKRRLTA